MKDVNENLLAKALQTASLADPQEGSVVSKTLIDKKVGTITLFCVCKGAGIKRRVAPYDICSHSRWTGRDYHLGKMPTQKARGKW